MSKNVFIFSLIFLLCVSSIHAFKTSTSFNETELEFSFSFNEATISQIVIENTSYDRIQSPDCELVFKAGKPVVPAKPLRILLPKQHVLKSMQVKTSSAVLLKDAITAIELGPTSYPLSMPPDHYQMPVPQYDQSMPYPEQCYEVLGVQYFRGYPILHVNLYPVNYNQITRSVQYYPKMDITINTIETNAHPLYRMNSEDFKEVLKKTDLIDTNVLSSYEIDQQIKTHAQNSQSAEYMVITTEEFKNYNGSYGLTTLLSKRSSQGLTTAVKTIEEIYTEYPGKDTAEQIRNFIIDSYRNQGTNWVLLVGDVEFVPVRYLYDIDGGDMVLASDHYYQCLDGDFDSDNDSWYGEKTDGVNGAIIDLYAEVYIGRASVDNIDQLKNFIRKTHAYESSIWSFDEQLSRVESVGEYIWSGSGGWGSGYVERCIDRCLDYGMDTRGISSDRYQIQSRYERDRKYHEVDLIDDINNGVNIINHLGHSSPTYCMRFSPHEIFALENDYYGFWYSQGCHPGQFDVVDDCIAEAWTVAEHGGFAAVMNTGFGYGSNHDYDGPDNRFAREFYDALNNTFEDISRLGKANQDSKEDNIWHLDDGIAMYHNYYSTTLFGDPFVQIKGMEDFRADFTWTPEFISPGDLIEFHDRSLSADAYFWDFDDGNTSTEKHPVHRYQSEGSYTVRLEITDDENKKDVIYKQVDVFENWPPFAVPIPEDLSSDLPTIQFQASSSWDPDGIVVDFFWDFGDGNTSSDMAPVHTFSEDGLYDVTLTVTDDGGKKGIAVTSIRIDQHTPPQSELVISGKRGNNDWLVSTAHLSIQSYDYSEIERVKYRIDDGDWQTYRNPVALEEPGAHHIQYYAEDVFGAVEQTRSEMVNIDTIPPVLSVGLNGSSMNGWYTTPVQITCVASDDISGIFQTYYRKQSQDQWQPYIDPVLFDSDGRYVFEVFSEDRAGLNTEKQKFIVAIDQYPPVSMAQVTGNPSSEGTVFITLTSIDQGSGVKEIFYSFDNQNFTSYDQPISVKNDGMYTLYYYAVDHLLHMESVKQQKFRCGIEANIEVKRPTPGLYVQDVFKIGFKDFIIAFGPITIEFNYSPLFLSLDSLQISVDGTIEKTFSAAPYEWTWSDVSLGRKQVVITARSQNFLFQEEISILKIG